VAHLSTQAAAARAADVYLTGSSMRGRVGVQVHRVGGERKGLCLCTLVC